MSTEQDEQVERLLRSAAPRVGPAPVEGIRRGAGARRRTRASVVAGAVVVGLAAVVAAAVPSLTGMTSTSEVMADESSVAAKGVGVGSGRWSVVGLPAAGAAYADVSGRKVEASTAAAFGQSGEQVAVTWDGNDLVLQDQCLRVRVRHEPPLPETVNEATGRGGVETTLNLEVRDRVENASCVSALGFLQEPLRTVDRVTVLREGMLTYRAGTQPVLELARMD